MDVAVVFVVGAVVAAAPLSVAGSANVDNRCGVRPWVGYRVEVEPTAQTAELVARFASVQIVRVLVV